MKTQGKSQFAILGMLALLKQSSGYDLKKHIESTTEFFWKEGFSSIYPVLASLEKQQLITKVETTRNGRERNLYTLTQSGMDTLKEWLELPAQDIHIRNELMLKVFFGDLVPTEITIQHLENQKQELQKKLTLYQEIKKELPHTHSRESIYSLLTLDHGIRQAKSSLEWCEQAIKTLHTIDH